MQITTSIDLYSERRDLVNFISSVETFSHSYHTAETLKEDEVPIDDLLRTLEREEYRGDDANQEAMGEVGNE